VATGREPVLSRNDARRPIRGRAPSPTRSVAPDAGKPRSGVFTLSCVHLRRNRRRIVDTHPHSTLKQSYTEYTGDPVRSGRFDRGRPAPRNQEDVMTLFAHHAEAYFAVEINGRSFPDGMTEHAIVIGGRGGRPRLRRLRAVRRPPRHPAVASRPGGGRWLNRRWHPPRRGCGVWGNWCSARGVVAAGLTAGTRRFRSRG